MSVLVVLDGRHGAFHLDWGAFAGRAVFVLHYTSQLSQHRWLRWA